MALASRQVLKPARFNAGIDTLYAETGDDSVYGGTENDVLYGGAGIDQFVFAKDDGADTMYDYVDNSDNIRITTAGLTFANLSFVEVSGGMQITHDAGDTITVLAVGLDVASFTASDFVFG